MKKIIKYITLGAFILCWGIIIIFGPKKIAMVLNHKAVAKYNKGQVQEAIDLYAKSLKMYPEPKVYYNLACAYDAQNQIEKAIENYKNTLSLDLNHKQACWALADIYRQQKDFKQAEVYIKKFDALETGRGKSGLKELKSEQLISLCNQAINEYKQNNIKQAINVLKQVLVLDRNYAPAHKILGEIYYSRNDLSNAIISYTAAISFGDKDPLIYSNIGVMYMKLENYTQAVKFLQQATKLAPGNLNIKYSLASVLRDNNQTEKALNIYKQIADVSPQYQNIHNDIAGIYQLMGLAKKAMEEFKQAKQIALNLKAKGKSNSWTFLSLAIALDGLNEQEKAKIIINELILENPDFGHAYYIRARILKKEGQTRAANADLAKARKLARRVKPIGNVKSSLKPNSRKGESLSAVNLKIDTLVKLKNGQIIKGKLKKQTDSHIVLEINMGSSVGSISFSKQKILELIKLD